MRETENKFYNLIEKYEKELEKNSKKNMEKF